MIDKLLTIAGQFDLEGTIAEIKPLGEGFINDTYVVRTEGDAPDYILQRKNHLIFPDVPGMMDNIKAVTEHIKRKVADPMRETLTVIPAKDGKLYVRDGENFWAVCLFIPDTTSPSRAESPEQAYQGGLGTGRFQALLADFDRVLSLNLLEAAAAIRAAAEAEVAAAANEHADDPEAEEIEALIAARAAAKKEKNYAEADRIRAELTQRGITLTDTAQGTTWAKA